MFTFCFVFFGNSWYIWLRVDVWCIDRSIAIVCVFSLHYARKSENFVKCDKFVYSSDLFLGANDIDGKLLKWTMIYEIIAIQNEMWFVVEIDEELNDHVFFGEGIKILLLKWNFLKWNSRGNFMFIIVHHFAGFLK